MSLSTFTGDPVVVRRHTQCFGRQRGEDVGSKRFHYPPYGAVFPFPLFVSLLSFLSLYGGLSLCTFTSDSQSGRLVFQSSRGWRFQILTTQIGVLVKFHLLLCFVISISYQYHCPPTLKIKLLFSVEEKWEEGEIRIVWMFIFKEGELNGGEGDIIWDII